MESLFLSCRALASPTICRFIPAHPDTVSSHRFLPDRPALADTPAPHGFIQGPYCKIEAFKGAEHDNKNLPTGISRWVFCRFGAHPATLLRRWTMRSATAVIFTLCFWLFAAGMYAQQATPSAPVKVDGQPVFVLGAGVGSFTPEERAEAVSKRLQAIVTTIHEPVKVNVQKVDSQWLLVVGNQPVLAITEQDTRYAGENAQELATHWAAALQIGLNRAQERRDHQTLARRLAITGVVSLGRCFCSWGCGPVSAACGKNSRPVVSVFPP